MQPQDQNYQANNQTNQQPIDGDQDIDTEQLEPAPSQEDYSTQPPQTPFVDGSPDQNDNDIPDVPDLSSVPSSDSQEMEHLAEPPTQSVSNTEDADQPSAPATEELNEQNNQIPESYETSQPEVEAPMETLSADEPVAEPSTEAVSVTGEPELPATNTTQDVEVAESQPEAEAPMETLSADEPVAEPSTEAVSVTGEPELPATNTTQDVEVAESQPDVEVLNDDLTGPVTVEGMAPLETVGAPVPETQPATSVEAQLPTERVSLTDHSSFEPQEPQTVTNTTVASPEEKENIYTEICSEIIKEQEQIIGTLAVEQAGNVEGLSVDPVTFHCTVTGDGSKVIDDLIEQYRDFFGHAAVEVCKEAASRFLARLPAEELPTSLR